MSELPTGWTTCRIRDVVLPFETVDPAKNPDQPFTYVDISSIDNQTQRIHEPKTILGKDAPSRARRRIEAGDILFSTVRTYLKNIAVVPPELDGAVTSTGIAVLRPSPKIETNYLFHLVCSSDFLTNIGAIMDGTLYPAVTDRDVLNQEIPLPPPDEQRRIVARLDALLARTRRAREELARVPALAERAKQAVLAKAFSGELTEEWRDIQKKDLSSWNEDCLSTLAEIGTGSTPKRGNSRYYENGTIPWVTSAAVNDPIIMHADEFITEIALQETNCKVFPIGTLLVAMYGEGQTRGKVSILGIASATNQALAAIQIKNSEFISKEFVLWFLRGNYLELRQQAAGGVQPNLNLGIIKAFRIPIPSPKEQAEIVARIEAAFARIDRAAAEAGRALALLERTEQAALAKAFRGELG